MIGESDSQRRLVGLGEIGRYDALYISTYEGDAALSCAARIVSERRRGLRILVVTVFGGSDATSPGGDHLVLGFAGVSHRDPGHDPYLPESRTDEVEATVVEAAGRLEEIFRRATPRHLYIPLGVGNHVDSQIAHEAALRTFHVGAGRDVFLYEERPESLVSGSVRIRLGQLGARLPPAANRVVGEGGLLRFLVRLQTVPRSRGGAKGFVRRVRFTRSATRLWLRARAWSPLKALGPRLQPLVHTADPKVLDDVKSLARAAGSRLGPSGADRFLALAADQARRLGERDWAERYWLLLPEREGAVQTAAGLEAVGSLN